MAYIDGFVLPVPIDKIDAYRAMAQLCGEVYLAHGALRFCELLGDDLVTGRTSSFPQSVMLAENEVVVFSWIEYASREARDDINAKVRHDPRLAHLTAENIPFDGKRTLYGGFVDLVSF